MKEVRKKSVDAATNAMLVAAYRAKTDVIWDRTDAMQPQCGFGRLSICCTDCHEGPCRTNPFALGSQQTICGRTQDELVSSYFLKKVADGAAALAGLAHEFRVDLDSKTFHAVRLTDDSMLAPANYSGRITEIGQTAASLLQSISAVKARVYGEKEMFVATTANLGSLKADAANIVLHGHIDPHITRAIMKAISKHKVPINIVGMCGGEAGGDVPIVTNYDSQEMPLLTESVDLLVIGSQCVMPAAVSLAKKRNVAVIAASSLSNEENIQEAVLTAANAFKIRKGNGVNIPPVSVKLHTGYTRANSKKLVKAVKTAVATAGIKGIAYLGGCGNIAKTQDEQIIRLASRLISSGYLIIAAGCAGVALAKAGMCHPAYASREGLQGVSELGIPPVLLIGSCHDAGEFLLMAQDSKANGMPVFAVMQEISHNKILATAAAFASAGIRTYIDLGESMTIPKMDLPGELLPISALEQFAENAASVVTAP